MTTPAAPREPQTFETMTLRTHSAAVVGLLAQKVTAEPGDHGATLLRAARAVAPKAVADSARFLDNLLIAAAPGFGPLEVRITAVGLILEVDGMMVFEDITFLGQPTAVPAGDCTP